MTTFTLISSLIGLCIFIFGIYRLSTIIHKNTLKGKDDELKTRLSSIDIFLLLLAIGLVILSFLTPFIFTRASVSNDFDFTSTGQIGDTIGGLMSPFINLSAVIVTGLAFYMQYKANKLQVKIFKKQLEETQNQFRTEQEKQERNSLKQRFESQFYEMLRLHKENVNEIEIDAKKRYINENANFDEEPEKYYEYVDYVISKRNAFVEMQKELEFMIAKLELSDTPELNFESFQTIYEIYFWGLLGYESIAEQFTDESSKKFEDMLYNIQQSQYSKDIFSFNTDIPFDIPAFKGHSNFLGHYYRHLFHTVKFVVNFNSEIIEEEEKTKYLRLLRAQLSNHEQALLFYNWLAQYGSAWENDTNNFLTKYKMIHNLWYRELPQKSFIQNKLKKLVEKYKTFERRDELFEMGDSIIENS